MDRDSGLSAVLTGWIVPSEVNPGVHYRLAEALGHGGMGVAFSAMREAPDGVTPAVLKVMRPEIVGTAGETALLMIQKEAIALGRLNERFPPTPFVVRFLDTGTVSLPSLPGVPLPWIALEHVHGGAEGTTLEQRVEYSIRNTRFAFDAARVAHVVECLAEALTAIHDVGVVHRDLKPGNVLCCGFGTGEVPKIADFGIARPMGVRQTFGGVLLGTPGYAAPEQSFSSEGEVGPWTDVFSFACVVYYLLTGEQYFHTTNFAHALLLVREGKRRSILDATSLTPELRDNPAACRAIDAALARATALKVVLRTPDARTLASMLLPILRFAAPKSQRASERLVDSVARGPATEPLVEWTWTVRHPPGDERLVRSVAWDGDGHCLAVTTDGLFFWDGTSWLPARAQGFEASVDLQTVSLVRPGQWMVGGKGGKLALISSDRPRFYDAPPHLTVNLASGDPDDLALLVGEGPGGTPELHSVAAGHFFRPTQIEAARTIAAIARVDETRWLVGGRTHQGSGFTALYSAVSFETTFLGAPPTDAWTTAAGQVDRGLGLAAGRRGATVRFGDSRVESAAVDGNPDLASSAIDVQGRSWVGGVGRLWTRAAQRDAPFRLAWEGRWSTPFVSLRADVGVVSAVTVDGGVLEGRAGRAGGTLASS